MPPLIPSYILAISFGIATLISIRLFWHSRDYTALALLPGTLWMSIMYAVADKMDIEMARVWVRLGLLQLSLQIILLFAWKYHLWRIKK